MDVGPPEEEELTLLTAAQFIEVLETGNCDVYEAELNEHYDIIINDVITTEPVIIRDGAYKKILIKNAIFQSYVEIDENATFDCLNINGGVFQSYLSVKGGVFQSFSIGGSAKFKELFIRGGTFKEFFIISGGVFHSTVYIDGSGNFTNFIINGGTFNSDLVFGEKTKIKIFTIGGGTFNSEIHITGSAIIGRLQINKAKIEKRFIINSGRIINNDQLIDASPRIAMITMSNTFNTRMIISNALIHKFHFREFYNEGSIKLINIKSLSYDKVKSNVTIEDSSLGNTEIIGCDWSQWEMMVDNSKIIDLFYTDTIFPNAIDSAESDEKLKYEQIRDTYGQLKTIADKQNDRPSSLNFQAKANDCVYKLKSIGLTKWNVLDPNWADWFQLWMSKWSNNFGTSYTLAIKRLILISPILYILYLVAAVDTIEWTKDTRTWGSGIIAVWQYWGDFFGFLNPAREFGYLCPEGGCTSGWAKLIDWFSRAVIAYLLYQAIQAFRKYGKN